MKDTLPSTLGSLDLEAQPRAPTYALQIIGAAGIVSRIVQPGQSIRIGRRRESDIIVEHASASRDHAVIQGGEPPTIEDLGSSNGTRVQGNRIAPRTPLQLPAGTSLPGRATPIPPPQDTALPTHHHTHLHHNFT